ncbi:MAG: hypothetical protein ACREJ9_13505, partial [Candidatus Rokuibacteriota bacterium]
MEHTLGGRGWRQNLLRAGLALVLVAGLVWALPIRRPGESGGHHAASSRVLDHFERAGVTEFREG